MSRIPQHPTLHQQAAAASGDIAGFGPMHKTTRSTGALRPMGEYGVVSLSARVCAHRLAFSHISVTQSFLCAPEMCFKRTSTNESLRQGGAHSQARERPSGQGPRRAGGRATRPGPRTARSMVLSRTTHSTQRRTNNHSRHATTAPRGTWRGPLAALRLASARRRHEVH